MANSRPTANIFMSGAFAPWPAASPNSGPFAFAQEQEDVSQNITAKAPHDTISAEELRLEDYAHGRGVLPSRNEVFQISSEPLQGIIKRPIDRAGSRYRGAAVTFKVGTERETFVIQERIIASASEFVRLALQGDWQEAQNREIPLPDDDPEVFEIYQIWLYDRKVDYSGCLAIADPATSFVTAVSATTDGNIMMLLKAWLLGDKFMDAAFKDAVMDAIIAHMLKWGGAMANQRSLAAFIYDNTPDASTPRRLMTDIFVHESSPDCVDDDSILPYEAWNLDFLRDLSREQFMLCEQLRKGKSVVPAYTQPESTCRYHDHEDGECFRISGYKALPSNQQSDDSDASDSDNNI